MALTVEFTRSGTLNVQFQGSAGGVPPGTYQLLSEKDAASGYAGLDGSGLVLFTQLPTLDEDNLISDSAVHVPTQQSVKAYVDAISGVDLSAYQLKAEKGHESRYSYTAWRPRYRSNFRELYRFIKSTYKFTSCSAHPYQI